MADPPVLILDEATSSIDTRTERLIEKGMDSLMADRTVFVIARIGIGKPRGGPDLLIGGVQLAVADVVGDGAGEEVGILKDDAHNLINRFYEIESGLITYDGIDVRDIRKESLRRP